MSAWGLELAPAVGCLLNDEAAGACSGRPQRVLNSLELGASGLPWGQVGRHRHPRAFAQEFLLELQRDGSNYHHSFMALTAVSSNVRARGMAADLPPCCALGTSTNGAAPPLADPLRRTIVTVWSDTPITNEAFKNIMERIRDHGNIKMHIMMANGWLWVEVATPAQAARLQKRLDGATIMKGDLKIYVRASSREDWPPGMLPDTTSAAQPSSSMMSSTETRRQGPPPPKRTKKGGRKHRPAAGNHTKQKWQTLSRNDWPCAHGLNCWQQDELTSDEEI